VEQKIEIQSINNHTKSIEEKVESVENISVMTLENVSEIDEKTKTIEDNISQLETNTVTSVVSELKDLFSCHSCEKVIVVTGGEPSQTAGTSAEALNADGTRLCRLTNLPNNRRYHSMDGSMICGGYDSHAQKSCIKFQYGAWKTMPFSLQQKRYYHVSWTRSDGKIRLLSGFGSASDSTSELVSETGSVAGFPLKYKTWQACGIEFEDQVIVTGGRNTMDTVSIYNDDGWVRDLASLKTGRYVHSCSHYTSDNDLKYIVVGGRGNDHAYISSTEIYSTVQLKWNYGVQLPSARGYFSGISLNNNVFLLGGTYYDGNPFSDVFKLDKENGHWIKVDEMSMPRANFESSMLPLKDIKPYCLSG